MFTLQISYPVRDYEAFKKVFDTDPAGRAASGARSVRLFRDTEDQNSVAVLLDFDTRDAATGFLDKLRSQVWDKPEVIGQLMTAAPTARILEESSPRGPGRGLTTENPVVLGGRVSRHNTVAPAPPSVRHHGAGCSADPESDDTAGAVGCSVAGAGSGL